MKYNKECHAVLSWVTKGEFDDKTKVNVTIDTKLRIGDERDKINVSRLQLCIYLSQLWELEFVPRVSKLDTETETCLLVS